jgi:hypothetical protein
VGGGSDDLADVAAPGASAGARATTQPRAAASAGASPVASPSGTPAASAGSGADVARITELTRTVMLSGKPADICRDKLSAKFVMTAFTSVKRCARTWNGDSDKPTGVSVSGVRVNGAAATATVAVRGTSGTAAGTWAFLRAGQTWRVAAWGVDFLRARYRADFGPGYRPDGPTDMLGYPTLRTCLTTKLDRLGDAALTDLSFAIMRRDAAATKAFQQDVLACAAVPDGDGVSTLRHLTEIGIRQSLEAKGMGALLDCVTAQERRTISDAEILAAYDRYLRTQTYPPEFMREAFRIGYDCAAQAAAAPVGTRT